MGDELRPWQGKLEIPVRYGGGGVLGVSGGLEGALGWRSDVDIELCVQSMQDTVYTTRSMPKRRKAVLGLRCLHSTEEGRSTSQRQTGNQKGHVVESKGQRKVRSSSTER